MKKLILFFLSLTSFTYGQYCPYLGPDQLLPCGVTTTTLTADFSQCTPGGNNPNQTTNYTVSSTPYNPDSYNTGTQVNLTDDVNSGAITLPFNFCFFGQTYNTFYIGSNNWIGFSAGQTSTWITTTIPNGGGVAPMNCIMGPWQDINPGVGGSIRWAVYGTAPCRRLVVSYYQVPMFSCTSQLYSSQIKIYESTNVIETHIQNKPICASWNGGNAVHGLHNQNGTQAVLVQPPVSTTVRNNNQWATNNEGVRFTPSGPVVTPTPTWYLVGNPTPIGTGNSITVTPPSTGANYTCHLVYPSCYIGWAACNGQIGLGPDTVFVQPGPPNLPTPTINFTNPTCYQYCDGTIDVIPNGVSGMETISWNGPQPPQYNQTNLCSGLYSFTITDINGCDVVSNVILTDPPIVSTPTINYNDTICFGSNNEVYSVNPINGYTYDWQTIGSINSGQGTNSINVDWSQQPSGTITNAIIVTPTSDIGCVGIPSTIDLFVYNQDLVIEPIGPFCSYDDCVTLSATPAGGVFDIGGLNVIQFCPNIMSQNTNVLYTYNQSGCEFTTTSTVITYPVPILTLDPEYSFFELCEGDEKTIIFIAETNISAITTWMLDNQTYVGNVLVTSWNESGLYTIIAYNESNGCISEPDTAIIAIEECPEEIFFIPNTFTPDNDEFNQMFTPIITEGIDIYDYNMTIYNRWGEIVWETYDTQSSWDGTYRGNMCPDGVYTWVIRYGVLDSDSVKTYSGFVTIIR